VTDGSLRALRGVATSVLLLSLACSDGTRPARDDGVPPEVAQYAGDWPLRGRDYLDSRATFDSGIHAGNTAGPRWPVT